MNIKVAALTVSEKSINNSHFSTSTSTFLYIIPIPIHVLLMHGFGTRTLNKLAPGHWILRSLSRLSLGHTRSRDHRIARLVTNLGDVRLVTTTRDQSLGLIFGLPLMLFGKMHSMIGCDKIRTVM